MKQENSLHLENNYNLSNSESNEKNNNLNYLDDDLIITQEKQILCINKRLEIKKIINTTEGNLFEQNEDIIACATFHQEEGWHILKIEANKENNKNNVTDVELEPSSFDDRMGSLRSKSIN